MRRLIPSILAAAVLLMALPAFAGNPSGMLQYVPGSAQFVVGIDVDKVRGTPLWSQLTSLAESDADLQRSLGVLQTDAGFNPLETVTGLVLVSNVVSDAAADHALVLIETEYPAEQLAGVLTQDEYVAGAVGDIAYYRKGESAVAFLSSNIVAVGEFALIEPGLNAAAGQGATSASGAVASQLGAVDQSGAIFVAVDLPAGSQGAQAARLSIDLSSGFAVNLNVAMESDEVATETVTQLNAQLAGIAGAPEVAAFGLAEVVSGLQATANGSDIGLSVSIDAATFGQLTGTLGEMAQEELR